MNSVSFIELDLNGTDQVFSPMCVVTKNKKNQQVDLLKLSINKSEDKRVWWYTL